MSKLQNLQTAFTLSLVFSSISFLTFCMQPSISIRRIWISTFEPALYVLHAVWSSAPVSVCRIVLSFLHLHDTTMRQSSYLRIILSFCIFFPHLTPKVSALDILVLMICSLAFYSSWRERFWCPKKTSAHCREKSLVLLLAVASKPYRWG